MARRRRLGRPAELRRGAPRYPDRGSGAAAGHDRARTTTAVRLGRGKTRGPAQGRRLVAAQAYTLNDVVCWFLAARGRREAAYVRLRGILKDANFEPPQALRRLAAITDFDLFVSTTFDPLLAMALARQGSTSAAQAVILPIVRLQRELTARNHDDQWQHLELASSLYAQALADHAHAQALLREASALVAALPAPLHELCTVRLWHARIGEAVHGAAAANAAHRPGARAR
jgi:hypothetical protein